VRYVTRSGVSSTSTKQFVVFASCSVPIFLYVGPPPHRQVMFLESIGASNLASFLTDFPVLSPSRISV
jgi:hypothetical protein